MAQYQLPPLPKLPAKEMAGPTPWSNYVLSNKQVLAGAYPASLDDAETERILTTLLELGVNTFVCLQAEVNINTPEHAWRAQTPRKFLAKRTSLGTLRLRNRRSTSCTYPSSVRTRQQCNKVRAVTPSSGYQHAPCCHADGNVTTDSAMNRLAEDCIERVLRGEKLYIHCWGGHGRTGTLVAIMLGRLYNLPYTTALRYCQAFHDSRIYPQGVRSPQTPVQRAQVRRLLAAQSAAAGPTQSVISSIAKPLSGPGSLAARTSQSVNQQGCNAAKPAGSLLSANRQSAVPAPDNRSSQHSLASPLRA
ncbi:tyr_phosphatase_2 domain-containing protein, partial [Haematococcus lacustris]